MCLIANGRKARAAIQDLQKIKPILQKLGIYRKKNPSFKISGFTENKTHFAPFYICNHPFCILNVEVSSRIQNQKIHCQWSAWRFKCKKWGVVLNVGLQQGGAENVRVKFKRRWTLCHYGRVIVRFKCRWTL